MEPLSTFSASSTSDSAPPQLAPGPQPQEPQVPHGLSAVSANLMASPPMPGELLPPPTGSVAMGLPLATAPQSTPQARPPLPPATTTPGGTGSSATPTSTPRLRSSIACARCRRSKIKCTNAGAGTTCEACAHSGRECIYPAPGTTGATKRVSDVQDDDGTERVKRARARKTDPLRGYQLEKVPRDAEPLRAQVAPMAGMDSHTSPIRESIWQSPVLTSRVWGEVFEIFQQHYATELPFLHAPTFLPKLTEGATAFGASPSGRASLPDEDPLPKQLVGLGLLTLTARFHAELVDHYWSVIARDDNLGHREPSAASDYYASALRNIIVGENVLADQRPSLEKVQALLMLTFYDWSLSRGIQAWTYLGLAMRMAQTMGLFYEDMDPTEMWAMGFAAENAVLQVKSTQNFASALEGQEASSSDIFVEEECRRRTAWSCFILDRYLSNGSFRPGAIISQDLRVQLPCGEKAWAFGERVCTPFLSEKCSHNGERTSKKMRLLRIKREMQHGIQAEKTDAEARSLRRALEYREDLKVPCELDESEGLLSRFVKISEIWGKIARKIHAGSASLKKSNPKFAVTAAFEIENDLHKFKESSPRSFRLSDSNIRAHVAQHTAPPFTLLNAVYCVCRLVNYRDSLVFLPVTLESPIELDEADHGMDSPMKARNLNRASAQKFFAAAAEFMSLFVACRSQRLLSHTPMMGFGLYLVSFAGIYAFNFPHMDSEGAVCGSDKNPRVILENQQIVLEALRALAQMHSILPVAKHWFRTLHRLHTYYRKASQDYQSSPQSFSRLQKNMRKTVLNATGNATLSATHLQERTESIVRLDNLFKELGSPEDDLQNPFQAQTSGPYGSTNGVSSISTAPPQPANRQADIWNPVNNGGLAAGNSNLSVGEPYNPAAGPPSHYPPLYQSSQQPSTSSPANTGHQSPSSLAKTERSLSPLPPLMPSNAPNSSPSAASSSTAANTIIYHWTMMQQPLSGEDVAAFIDGRSEAEWAAMKASWDIVKEDAMSELQQGPGPATGSQEMRLMGRAEGGPKWWGVIWGWI